MSGLLVLVDHTEHKRLWTKINCWPRQWRRGTRSMPVHSVPVGRRFDHCSLYLEAELDLVCPVMSRRGVSPNIEQIDLNAVNLDFSNSVKGKTNSTKFSINRRQNPAKPRNLCNSVTIVSAEYWVTVSTILGSACTHCALTTCSSCGPNWAFLGLYCNPLASDLLNTHFKDSTCSLHVFENIKMPSI